MGLRGPWKGKSSGDQIGDPFENQFSRGFFAGINWLLCLNAQYHTLAGDEVIFFEDGKFQPLASHNQVLTNTILCVPQPVSQLSIQVGCSGFLAIVWRAM